MLAGTGKLHMFLDTGDMSRNFSRGMLPLLAIHVVNEYYRLPWKPPVTASLLAANSLVYLRPFFLRGFIPPVDRVWFNPYVILKHRDMTRMLLSPFYHVGDAHLFYNMTSLLWKGVRLESSMGSLDFASMVATLLVLSQGANLLLSKSLLVFNYERAFFFEYSVGFSGVLFAMKVVLNSMSAENDLAFVSGIAVPVKYAAWVELILVQMFLPGVSFWGHLGGVLAGFVYVKLRDHCSGSDPLGLLLRGCLRTVISPFKFAQRVLGFSWTRRRRGRFHGAGTPSIGDIAEWRCEVCTFDNSGWMDACEMCGFERGNSSFFHRNTQQNGRGELNLEEIRRRRIQRFGH